MSPRCLLRYPSYVHPTRPDASRDGRSPSASSRDWRSALLPRFRPGDTPGLRVFLVSTSRRQYVYTDGTLVLWFFLFLCTYIAHLRVALVGDLYSRDRSCYRFIIVRCRCRVIDSSPSLRATLIYDSQTSSCVPTHCGRLVWYPSLVENRGNFRFVLTADVNLKYLLVACNEGFCQNGHVRVLNYFLISNAH